MVAVIGRAEAKMLLYKDSFTTGIIGLIFLVSPPFGKPVAYWFGQRFAGGGETLPSRGIATTYGDPP